MADHHAACARLGDARADAPVERCIRHLYSLHPKAGDPPALRHYEHRRRRRYRVATIVVGVSAMALGVIQRDAELRVSKRDSN